MGWSNGSEIADKIWRGIKPFIPSDERALAEVSKRIYKIFEEYDADDWFYQLFEEDSLYETYLKLNKPKEYKDLKDETC